MSRIPADRWPQSRFGHPKGKERGRSYTWAAGVLEDIWGFDPGVFRISPREAEQIDPQQRLLLELVFEACEDAGLPPSRLAGSGAGVYVGASALDYSTIALHDPALADAYFATGNTLSIISNRISYIFDLHGPSLTIDTACSSSLVALHEACEALAHGEIDAAVVGGVNILAGPFGFVSFSQATMLSPTGLCRAFSANADGYVRSEGGVVLLLKTLDRALADGDRVHAVIRGSGVNSDGRTSGISLPAEAFQTKLLRAVYERAAVSADAVVYVEAHGAGTQAGDPVEASALGTILGRVREKPLPIGSIKTNVGHLEPASGLAGLLKAMLALEHDEAPRSLHFERPNPNIDFARLNLAVTAEATALPPRKDQRFAGVSSFGFGGTNAHVVLTDPPKAVRRPKSEPRYLMLSAQTEAALRTLAGQYAARLTLESNDEVDRIVAATDYRRERMRERLVLPAGDQTALQSALKRFADLGRPDAIAAKGTAIDGDKSVVFVFSGNGAQWEGMGREALRRDAHFREALREIDSHFFRLARWSLQDKLGAPDLKTDLARTSIAQPLIFAVQAASVRALAAIGVRPSLTMGHSVGEVAAAEAAGALTLGDAVKVIYDRSRHQEATAFTGGMAAVIGSREASVSLVRTFPALTIAAHNSYRCIVAAGPIDALEALAIRARETQKVRVQRLDLAYPFHTPLMERARRPLLESLSDLAPSASAAPFLSTIADAILPGPSLDNRYWWRNVREPVLFQEGVERAIEMGKRVFLEIGPRPILRGHIRDAINHRDVGAVADAVHDEEFDDLDVNPFEHCAIRLLVAGAQIDSCHVFGTDPGAGVDLPAYPWRRTTYRYGETTEATGAFSLRARHPLVGARDSASLEWRTHLDPELEPALGDHRVQGQILLPGAAFIEMGVAIARDWKDSDAVALADLEILRPLSFAGKGSREILCRISAATSTFEIMSRPRLSTASFVLHARGAIVDKAGAVDGGPAPADFEDGHEGEALYSVASQCGLEFGPAFRQLARARRAADDVIEVELSSQGGDARYGLDPARLDSCFHGLILLFSNLGRETVGYLPVRFDKIRLMRPAEPLARGRLRIRRADDRAIVADYELFDDLGRIVATLSGARYQPARTRPSATLSQTGLVERWIPATAELTDSAPAFEVAPPGEREPSRLELPPQAVLIEGWASAAASELAHYLGVERVLDIDELVRTGRLPSENRLWAQAIFDALEASGLLTREASFYRLNNRDMPPAEAALTSFAWQYPDRATELLLAASVGSSLRAYGSGKGVLAGASDAAREAFDLRSASAAAAAMALSVRLEPLFEATAHDQALRILQVGYGPSTTVVARLAARQNSRLTVFDPDARRLERARHRFGRSPEISFCDNLEGLKTQSFDLIVSSGGLSRLSVKRGALPQLAGKGAANARLVAIEPAPSLFQSLVFGLNDDWFGDDGECLRSAEGWRSHLTRMGLSRVRAELTVQGGDVAVAIEAQVSEARSILEPRTVAPAPEVLIVREGSRPDDFMLALKRALTKRHAACRVVERLECDASSESPPTILAWPVWETEGDGVRRVAAQVLALKRLAMGLGSAKADIFVPIDESDRPVAGAVSSFLRTLGNEIPALSIHRVEIRAWTSEAADKLAAVILSGAEESDIAIRDGRVEVLRYAPPDLSEARTTPGPGAWRLEKSPDGGLDRLQWNPAPRVAPKEGQIEVEVVATGLNFRDVMWALSVLPDDMLEDGFAGPTLGLEFSGRVVRVGPDVTAFRIGDEVVGFCGGAFSAYVTVDVDHAVALPSSVSCESAATVPVAFLTAYYGLIGCANLQPGEWVLIHGGAGGVGMAALQIAQWRGARAIITAGAQEKRDLTITLGAEYAFDSRSGAFVDDVMRVTEGRGVSVVLNSLAGQAMESSIGLLQPFGRFVELGKRDYLANTPVGLRPFRRNLSYFGVDLDQILLSRPDVWRRLFSEVLEGFDRGDFAPLPYTVFDSADIVEAMRLMQQSGHVGRILVRPPPSECAPKALRRSEFQVDATRTHLIAGGLGGFGIETARWLVERGARHLVLIGRTGSASQSARDAIKEMRARGAEIRVEAADIADGPSTGALFSVLKREMPPLAGVIHAAMVLDDAIVANIDERRLLDVLRPKICGAENLERLTLDLDLDYFVLFSSATTVIGNPGQGAYVAANGFLEGMARRRRSAGLPALAIGWGAIEDVGILARSTEVREAIAARAGVKGIKARVALDLMAEALAFEGGPSGDGVVAIADMNWSVSRSNLKGLTSPTYGRLLNALEPDEARSRTEVDLRELIKRRPPETARRAVADVVIEELARILRLAREDVSRSKPLSEIGLDSLMAVELTLALETRLGLDAPLGEAAGAFNVTELAARILASRLSGDHNFVISERLAARHLDVAERDEVVGLLGRLERAGPAAVAKLAGDLDPPR